MAAYLVDYGNGFADMYTDKDNFCNPTHIVLNDVSNGFIHGYADFNDTGVYTDIINEPVFEVKKFGNFSSNENNSAENFSSTSYQSQTRSGNSFHSTISQRESKAKKILKWIIILGVSGFIAEAAIMLYFWFTM